MVLLEAQWEIPPVRDLYQHVKIQQTVIFFSRESWQDCIGSNKWGWQNGECAWSSVERTKGDEGLHSGGAYTVQRLMKEILTIPGMPPSPWADPVLQHPVYFERIKTARISIADRSSCRSGTFWRYLLTTRPGRRYDWSRRERRY